MKKTNKEILLEKLWRRREKFMRLRAIKREEQYSCERNCEFIAATECSWKVNEYSSRIEEIDKLAKIIKDTL